MWGSRWRDRQVAAAICLEIASSPAEAVHSSAGWFHGESAGADAGVADHDESTCGEIIGDLLEIRENDCGEGSGLLVGAPGQDDARRQDRRVGQELSEVGIAGTRIRFSRSAVAMICSSPRHPGRVRKNARSHDLRRAATSPSPLAGTRRS